MNILQIQFAAAGIKNLWYVLSDIGIIIKGH
jgi:hypothetical protein